MFSASNKYYTVLVIWLVLFTFTPASVISVSLHSAVLESKMIPSDSQDFSKREFEEIKVRKVLENKILVQKLMQHGLSPQEAQNKIDLMTDEEVHQLAVLSDRLPAGGDSGVGFVVGVLVIAALVLLIIYLAKRV